MGYTQDKLLEAQKRMQDYVDSTDQRISTTQGQAKDILAGSDAVRKQGTADILGEIGSRYGVSGLPSAGADVNAFNDPRIARGRAEALGMMRQKAVSEKYNQLFNHAFDQYQAAGYTLQQSNEFARQWAADQSKQEYDAQTAQRSRDMRTKEQDIRNQYSTAGLQLNAMDPVGDPYTEAAARAGLNVAGMYTANAVRKSRKPALVRPSQIQGQPSFAGVGQNYQDMYDSYYGGGVTGSANQNRIAGT